MLATSGGHKAAMTDEAKPGRRRQPRGDRARGYLKNTISGVGGRGVSRISAVPSPIRRDPESGRPGESVGGGYDAITRWGGGVGGHGLLTMRRSSRVGRWAGAVTALSRRRLMDGARAGPGAPCPNLTRAAGSTVAGGGAGSVMWRGCRVTAPRPARRMAGCLLLERPTTHCLATARPDCCPWCFSCVARLLTWNIEPIIDTIYNPLTSK